MSGWQRDGRCDLTATKVERWHDESCHCTRDAMTVEEVFATVYAGHLAPRGWERVPHRSPNVLAVRHKAYRGQPFEPLYASGPLWSALNSPAITAEGRRV